MLIARLILETQPQHNTHIWMGYDFFLEFIMFFIRGNNDVWMMTVL